MKDFFVVITSDLLADKQLTANEKLIFGLIKNYLNYNKDFYWSNNLISNKLGISRQSVIRSIFKLEQLGYITLDYEVHEGHNTVRHIKIKKRVITVDDDLKKLFDKVYKRIKSK